jgi:SAM-dependent methyltransferase
MEHVCKICDNRGGNLELFPLEMMYGTREAFPYFQCSACGCLQIASVPDDLSRHYPTDYYSFSAVQPRQDPTWQRKLRSARVRSALEGTGALERLLKPVIGFPAELRLWTKLLGATQRSRILDVGCGGGAILRKLATLGFSSLVGVDPFIASDLSYPDGVTIRKQRLEELQGEFDCIMLHHSFEHMWDPYAVLDDVKRLLASGGGVLVRIPISSGEAFRTYGVNWVQLDPPRHFFLHSETSMRLLAKRAGFEVESVVYDSTAYQFWGSEQFRSDVSLFAPHSHVVDPTRSMFSPADIADYEKRARELNSNGDGDQACFVLRISARS